jgi:CRISPR/Cas system-associated endonuclease Cas3-HD
MILDEIKDLIKELENILIKDERFKDSYDFKNQVKIIYKHKNNLNNNLDNNFNISQLPNIDVTPFISNLITLNKPPEIRKSSEITEPLKDNQLPNECKEAMKKLIDKINEVYYQSSVKIDTKNILSTEDISELLNNLKNNSEKVLEIINKLS